MLGLQNENKVHMVYRIDKEKEDLIWTNRWRCSSFPVLALIGSTAGGFLTILIAGVIFLIVVINLRDLRAWKRYVAQKKENEENLGNTFNPLYVGNKTSFANPSFKNN